MAQPARTSGKVDNHLKKQKDSSIRDGKTYPVQGYLDPQFSRVFSAFAENFAEEDEWGSSAAVYYEGRLVVDLWGGFRDLNRSVPWDTGTLVNTMSVTKAMTAICLHRLIDRGQVALDAPVARYWPAFAANGKERLPVRHLLDHRAGLPVIEPLPAGLTLYDWDGMARALAAQTPLWPPGEQAGYHIVTQGFLIGELVRRIDGRSLGRFFREEIAQPMDIDFHIGLTPDEMARCAQYSEVRKGTILDREALDPTTLLARSWTSVPADVDFNSEMWRRSEFPSGNGHGTARGVARFFAALVAGGTLDGVPMLSAAAVDQALTEQHAMVEIVNNRLYHQALGVLLNSPPIVWMGPNARAFGHHGVGGSIGMGDREAKLAIAYLPNRMHARLDNGPRARRVIEAVYACL